MDNRYPEPPAELTGRRVLRSFGPGAIIASVTIGSGETVFASRGGALFGYALLWCFIGGGLMKFVQVYTAARYMTLTGEHPVESWRYLPGPQGWAVVLLSAMTILCFPLWLSGLPKMLGGLVVWIGGLEGGTDLWSDGRVWGTLFAAAAILLTLVQSYGALERTQTVIVGVLLLFILLATFACRPDWLAALQGSLVPSLPAYQPWVGAKYPAIAGRSPWLELGTYLGAIGGERRTTSATSACSGRRDGGFSVDGRGEGRRASTSPSTRPTSAGLGPGCGRPWPTREAAFSASWSSPWPS